MTKLQLIQALKESQNLSTLEAAQCVELFFSAMADALFKGDRVEISGDCAHFMSGNTDLTPGTIRKLARMQW